MAIDPGKLTGCALLERERDDAAGLHVVRLLESVETGPDETVPWCRRTFQEYGEPAEPGMPRMRVVIESFLITQRTVAKSQEASWALRTTGAVEQVCRDFGYPVDAIQFFSPDKKSAFPNPRLKKLGMWHVGGKGHALDGIRHGLIYLTQTGMLPSD
ncbi:MAG: hypothetical protein AB7G23_21405 [Vicinamibacterales bacterium]